MLSTAVGDTIMPGDYESWPGAAARMAPPTGPLRPPIPPPPPMVPTRRPPPPPQRGYPRRHRRQSLTPEIVMERRPHHHHHHHHGSSGRRNHVITIPMDHRPTLGLRGPPKRVIEIERVRCHRRRRPRSLCYEDYEDDSYYPPPLPPQSNFVIANPIPNPCLPTVQNSMINPAATLLNNLTPEALDSLPRQTVHLPPIHLPGSQADANTELQTVVFPAEIINPIDGSLSVIQANSSGINLNSITHAPTPMNISLPSQLTNLPANIAIPPLTQRPPVSPAMSANPLRQRFLDLFQRLEVSQPQTQPAPLPMIPNPPLIRPTLPPVTQFDPITTESNTGPYPPANIQPYRPIGSTPYAPTSSIPYRPSTFTPSISPSNPNYRPPIIPQSSSSSDVGPYRPANIRPYANVNLRSTANPPSQSSGYSPTGSLLSTNASLPQSIGFNTAYSPPTGPMPRSILRNPYPTSLSNTTYSRFNP